MSLLDTILESVTQLPPFPAVIQRAFQLVDDPKSSAQDVVDVIQYDQSITVNVLKLCNSAHFGLRRTVHSLRDALVLIGFHQLLEIILSQASGKFFSGDCKGYDLENGELWQHSVACALLPRII
jgi:HD-like signal output (HDOD) protein